jgi:hypothetical protein
MKQRTKIRILQIFLFSVGTLFIMDRTLRSASQFPPEIVLLNVTEVVVGFILFLIAINLEIAKEVS